jgi:hypothetical protein
MKPLLSKAGVFYFPVEKKIDPFAENVVIDSVHG